MPDVARETGAQFRLLVDSVREYAIFLLAPDGTVATWNAGAERFKGYRADEVIGRPFRCFYTSEDVAEGRPERHLATAAAEGRVEVEGWRVRKDGSRFWASVVITALRDESGTVLAYGKITRDVTERLRATEQLRAAYAELEARVEARTLELHAANASLRSVNERLALRTTELEERNRELEDFAYAVAHDVRAPAVNIQGFATELERSCAELTDALAGAGLEALETLVGPAGSAVRPLLDEAIPTSARFLRASAVKLEGLADSLLNLARAGRQVQEPVRVGVGAIVRATVDALAGTGKGRSAPVTVGALPDAYAHPPAVEQIFANLLGNALKYLTDARPGLIEVGGEAVGDEVHYWVRDNGAGIPPDAQPRLFRAFERFHPRLAQGHGMGLAIVKRAVDRQGGRIWMESHEGVGTTFHFTLPASAGSAVGG